MIKITITQGTDLYGIEMYHLAVGFYEPCSTCSHKRLDEACWVDFPIDIDRSGMVKVLHVLAEKCEAKKP